MHTSPWAARARYNQWMNERLYALAAQLTEAERRKQRGAFFGSIHGTLAHIMVGDSVWMMRFNPGHESWRLTDSTGEPVTSYALDMDLWTDFDQLRAQRARFDEGIIAWATTAATDDQERPFVYHTMAGARCEHPLWWAVDHFFNHQTHHRGQVTTLLMQAGLDPGVTDLIAFLRM